MRSGSSSSLLEMEGRKKCEWKMSVATVSILTGVLVVGIVNVVGIFELAKAVQEFKNSIIHF